MKTANAVALHWIIVDQVGDPQHPARWRLDQLKSGRGIGALPFAQLAKDVLDFLDLVLGALSRIDVGDVDDGLLGRVEHLQKVIRVAALSPAGQGTLSGLLAFLFNARFRAARRSMLGLHRAGPVAAKQLLDDAQTASERFAQWRSIFNTGPTAIPDLERMKECVASVAKMVGIDLIENQFCQRIKTCSAYVNVHPFLLY